MQGQNDKVPGHSKERPEGQQKTGQGARRRARNTRRNWVKRGRGSREKTGSDILRVRRGSSLNKRRKARDTHSDQIGTGFPISKRQQEEHKACYPQDSDATRRVSKEPAEFSGQDVPLSNLPSRTLIASRPPHRPHGQLQPRGRENSAVLRQRKPPRC